MTAAPIILTWVLCTCVCAYVCAHVWYIRVVYRCGGRGCARCEGVSMGIYVHVCALYICMYVYVVYTCVHACACKGVCVHM